MEKLSILNILQIIVPWFISLLSVFIAFKALELNKNIAAENKRNTEENKKNTEFNKIITEKNRAIVHSTITFTQLSEKPSEVSVTQLRNKRLIKVSMYPVQINVKSGAIVQVYPIISYFSRKGEQIIQVNANIQPQDQLRPMDNVNIKLIPNEIGTFWNNDISVASFYQSYLIIGADGSNHLVMIWYDGSQPRQGYLDVIRSVGVGEGTPEFVLNQFNKLRNYLRSKGIETI
ncbi:hypothetical protein ATO00_13535 [Loigolactobacillus coryniformis subsp. coryniformis]|uniref:Uncharacterized protein n=1 Tax=Loigolactobacillus coryniformis subsp. coryniformis KCTC 3167 = DSM 20001 TaxID=913848 RepID=A0A0R1F4B2_9LACO|nr:hypothetical protein [Loigolactobacillus coryniformis]ATO55139.1 hypothetical protein LC20001_05625 [Loigolactobacillus coryniformis subsp. coryniformis KCTC 3167 = DSM 20001]KRK13986.1 hypothetical protein FD22_GL000345 [Loigolactobacillus coryniformis subsp. coryniformis KCTC 3167 = DSM 20001]OEH89112.1 hypothetical protein ATO00_13535 [Loigolactobacillus coryniformis subsp. coryniformis]